jgi:DNA repair protein RadC
MPEENNQSTYRIQDMVATERPRERLARVGPQALSTAELLGILLRVGIKGENAVQIGSRLLQKYGGMRGLHKAGFHQLHSEKGLGTAKAAQILAALELGNRIANESFTASDSIASPSDVAALVVYDMSRLEQEELRVILLDTRNRIIHLETVYRGSLNSSTVRVGELFKSALQRSAASMVIVHNHPSGEISASPEDIALTRAVVQAGKLLDVEVLDHLIIGNYRYLSLKEKGQGF